MKYNPPFGQSNPTAPFIDGNPDAGVQGSIPPAASIEHPQREIVQAILDAGLTPSAADLTQLSQAIQRMAGSGALVHTGNDISISANTITATVSPAISSYVKGNIYTISVANAVTGAAVANFNGVGSRQICRQDGSPIQAGDILAREVTFVDDGTKLQLVSFGRAEVPRIVTNPVLYIRTDGNDGNDGSANDAGHAFATIAAAMAYATTRFSTAGQTITFVLGNAGTYAAPTSISPSGQFQIQGATAAQASYIIAGAGSGALGAVTTVTGGFCGFQNVTFSNTGSTSSTLGATSGGSIALNNVTFNNSTSANPGAHCLAGPGGSITINAGCIFQNTVNMGYMWLASGGAIQQGNIGVTVSGTPNFSSATAAAFSSGQIAVVAGGSISGAATGTRYLANVNGTISTSGGGANYFPGNAVGATATGGQYV